jgi:hypothetical protein
MTFTGGVDTTGRLDDDVRRQIADAFKAFAGKRVDVTVKAHRSHRSLDQNAYWWAVPVAILAEHCGYEPEQMHYVLLGEWRGYEPALTNPVPRCASSSKLTTGEFSDLIEWVQRWAATELDVQIPSPNEWQAAA